MILRALVRRHYAVSRHLSFSDRVRHKISVPCLPYRQSRQISTRINEVPLIGGKEHHEELETNGIEGFLSPEGFEIAWTEYQRLMVDSLETLLSGHPDKATLDAKNLAIATARDPKYASIFNYASMAHNNHFFFSGLSLERTNMNTTMPSELGRSLAASFGGSLHFLRDTFLATAHKMFGPGFVWLVVESGPSNSHPAYISNKEATSTQTQHFRIVTTFLAGSPYPGAQARLQGKDMNIQSLQTAQESQAQNRAGYFGNRMTSVSNPDPPEMPGYGGASIIPVLCVNTWEHCYLADYGVDGKKQYLAHWWDHIDWYRVEENARVISSPTYRR